MSTDVSFISRIINWDAGVPGLFEEGDPQAENAILFHNILDEVITYTHPIGHSQVAYEADSPRNMMNCDQDDPYLFERTATQSQKSHSSSSWSLKVDPALQPSEILQNYDTYHLHSKGPKVKTVSYPYTHFEVPTIDTDSSRPLTQLSSQREEESFIDDSNVHQHKYNYICGVKIGVFQGKDVHCFNDISCEFHSISEKETILRSQSLNFLFRKNQTKSPLYISRRNHVLNILQDQHFNVGVNNDNLQPCAKSPPPPVKPPPIKPVTLILKSHKSGPVARPIELGTAVPIIRSKKASNKYKLQKNEPNKVSVKPQEKQADEDDDQTVSQISATPSEGVGSSYSPSITKVKRKRRRVTGPQISKPLGTKPQRGRGRKNGRGGWRRGSRGVRKVEESSGVQGSGFVEGISEGNGLDKCDIDKGDVDKGDIDKGVTDSEAEEEKGASSVNVGVESSNIEGSKDGCSKLDDSKVDDLKVDSKVDGKVDGKGTSSITTATTHKRKRARGPRRGARGHKRGVNQNGAKRSKPNTKKDMETKVAPIVDTKHTKEEPNTHPTTQEAIKINTATKGSNIKLTAKPNITKESNAKESNPEESISKESTRESIGKSNNPEPSNKRKTDIANRATEFVDQLSKDAGFRIHEFATYVKLQLAQVPSETARSRIFIHKYSDTSSYV